MRGINNSGKSHEVSSCLNGLKSELAILIETRVKPHNAMKVRNKLGKNWNVTDNYSKQNNGRI